MAFLQSIALTQFRNFSSGIFSFDAPVVAITGLNGVGKTNLLDAIYYLCYTKSYFQSREMYNVQTGTNGFRIEGILKVSASFLPEEGPDDTVEKICCTWKEGKKLVQCNQSSYEKITEHIGKYTAVMIAPDDIALINDGSELRRKYIDGLLAQGDPHYLEHLLHYQKFLAQRNAYLKQAMPGQASPDLLDIYDEQLALHGGYLVAQRQALSAVMPVWVEQYYNQLSGGAEGVDIQYKMCARPDLLADLFRQYRRRDMEYRRTLAGPHTEDWLFQINGSSVKAHGSQGQKKSFLIALKLAHIQWLQKLGKKPFLLLDDIFEKLDKQRLSFLFDMLQAFSLSQIFMTHTAADELLETVNRHYKEVQILPLYAR